MQRKFSKSKSAVWLALFGVVSTIFVLLGNNRQMSRSLNSNEVLTDVNANLYIDKHRMSPGALSDVNANLFIDKNRQDSGNGWMGSGNDRVGPDLHSVITNPLLSNTNAAGEQPDRVTYPDVHSIITNPLSNINADEQPGHPMLEQTIFRQSKMDDNDAVEYEREPPIPSKNGRINMNSLSHVPEASNPNPTIPDNNAKPAGLFSQTEEVVPNKKEVISVREEIDPSEYSIVGKKILIAIPSYGQKQFLFLQDMIDSFRDLCETGAKVTMIIYTTEPYAVEQLHLLNSRTNSCYHPQGDLHLHVKVKPPSLKLHFVDSHRKDFYDNINKYDLFVYSEDDHLIRPTHVIGYLYETARLRRIVGADAFPNYSIGFLRYERDHDRAERHTFDQYEYENAGLHSFSNPALHDKYIGNRHMPHQGMFMATPEQLEAWKQRCNFHEIDPEEVEKGRGNKKEGMSANEETNGDLDTPIWHREYVSSLRLFANEGIPLGNCQVTQLFPADGHFENFMVHHMPDKYYENPKFEKDRNFNSMTLQQYRLRIFNRENGVSEGNDGKVHSYSGVTMELSAEDAREMQQQEGKETLKKIINGMDEYIAYVRNGGMFHPKKN